MDDDGGDFDMDELGIGGADGPELGGGMMEGGAEAWMDSMLAEAEREDELETGANPFKMEMVMVENTRLMPKLQRAFAAFDLGVPLQLEMMAARIRVLDYTKRAFRMARLHLNTKKGIAAKLNVASSGKCVIMSARDEAEAVYLAKKTCKLFRAVGVVNATVKNFRITNCVALSNLKAPVRIRELNEAYPAWTAYQPDISPGLRIKMHNPRCMATVFVNGKIVLIGFNNQASMPIIIGRLFPILQDFIGPRGMDRQRMLRKYFGDCITATKTVAGYKERPDTWEEDEDAAFRESTQRFRDKFSEKLHKKAEEAEAMVKEEAGTARVKVDPKREVLPFADDMDDISAFADDAAPQPLDDPTDLLDVPYGNDDPDWN